MAAQQQQQQFSHRGIVLYKTASLGSGSYGGVCRAKCGELPCAAKIMHPTLFDEQNLGSGLYLRKFEEECRFLSLARHPNIVQYLDTYRDPDTRLPVLLMEICDESLTKLLERSPGPLPYHLELNLSHDVALALDYLHSNDLIHRDLTSNNVLVIAGARAKVTDFGMSKLASVNPRMTKTQCPGNPFYMSPEAFDDSNHAHYTDKLDVFSFGVLLIQVMTRLFPEPGARFQEIEDPRYSTSVKVPIIETERRKPHLQKIEDTHPLKQIALRCLKNKAKDRPTAQVLSENLSELKQATRYDEGLLQGNSQARQASDHDRTGRHEQNETVAPERNGKEEEEQLRSRVQQLQETVDVRERVIAQNQITVESKERELQQSQRTIETRERELRQKHEQLQTSKQLLQQCQQQIQQKDETIRELQQTVAARERKIQQLEQQERSTNPQRQRLLVTTERPPSAATNKMSATAQSGSGNKPPATKIPAAAPTLKWEVGSRAPEKMAAGTAVVHQNTAYFNPSSSDHVYAFQLTSAKAPWSSLPSTPHTMFSLAVISDLVTTVGGYKAGSTEATNVLLSLTESGRRKKKEWAKVFPPMPTARGYTTAFSTEKYLVVAGGRVGGSRPKKLDAIEVMNTGTKQWTVSTRLPYACSDLTSSIYDGRLYLAGGYKDEDVTKAVLTCSLSDLLLNFPLRNGPQPRIWQLAGDLPVVRSTLVTCAGQLFAIGGRDDSRNPSSNVHRYEPRTNTWHVISQMPTKRSVCLAAVLPQERLVVVGGYMKVNDIYAATDNVEMAML